VNAASDAILARIDANREAEIGFLAELVKCPSDNPPGDLAPHADKTARLLAGLGFTVERHAVPPAEAAAKGLKSVTNLIVRHRFGPGGPTIALNAHGDVVPPGEGWSVDPYGAVIKNGWMHGRGVAVSKSDFATYAFALKALIEAGGIARGAIELHLTYDEESGGEVGPAWLLAKGLSRPDYAIAAGFTYALVTAHNGCLHLEVRVEGLSAHAAKPETGHDALEAATGLLAALYAHRATLAARKSRTPGIAHPTLVVGLISGGINTNVVPDAVTFRLDRRIVPEESPEAAEAETNAVIAEAAGAFPGIRAVTRRVLLARPFQPVPGQEKLIAALGEAGRRVLREDIPATGVPLYTDARHYSAAGIPTVSYGAGPRDILEANAHRADERLPLDDLIKATRVVALAVARLLG